MRRKSIHSLPSSPSAAKWQLEHGEHDEATVGEEASSSAQKMEALLRGRHTREVPTSSQLLREIEQLFGDDEHEALGFNSDSQAIRHMVKDLHVVKLILAHGATRHMGARKLPYGAHPHPHTHLRPHPHLHHYPRPRPRPRSHLAFAFQLALALIWHSPLNYHLSSFTL